MKTKEELNALREEVENLGKKLAELTEEELSQVAGGIFLDRDVLAEFGYDMLLAEGRMRAELKALHQAEDLTIEHLEKR